MNKPKVDIAIVGFQKAGTTSILKYLSQQEEVCAHPQKEMTYFSVSSEYEKGWEQAVKRYFSHYTNGKKLVVKHATLIRHEASIKRLYEHNPDAKIIVCLRDPVQRAYSSYLMEKASGNQTQNFNEVIKEAFVNHNKGKSDWRYNVFVKLGEYVHYLDMLIKYFSRASIYILHIEDFHIDKENEFIRLCKWLKINSLTSVITDKQHNEYKVERSSVLARLVSFLLSERSLIKRAMKKIVPVEKQANFGDRMRALVKKKAVKEPLSLETKIMLQKHFDPYQVLLNKKYLGNEQDKKFFQLKDKF